MILNGNRYAATAQLIADAIERSIDEGEPVTIEPGTHGFEGIHDALYVECEDVRIYAEVVTHHGHRDLGDGPKPWSVRVLRGSEEG